MAFRTIPRLFGFCLPVFLVGCSLAPAPLTDEQIVQVAIQDREQIFVDQQVYDEPLTLEVAMALALKYNLENRVRLLEETLASQQLGMAQIDLLPSLAASAGYTERDNINASTSVSLETGNVSLEPSTSQNQVKVTGNGRFTWNLLDFGVSYLQAKQDADRYLIAGKARQKIMLSLLKEVRAAYWQAVAMEKMREELDGISQQVDEMLVYWQSVRELRLRPPVSVLMDIRALIETRQQLDDIRQSIDTAQARLGNLINAPDLRSLNLPKDIQFPKLQKAASDIEAMELIALSNSGDYLSEVYKVRIDHLETRKAMLQLLPGLDFSYSSSYDDNQFLVNNTWDDFGVNLTGDLGRLFFTKRIRKFREASEELTISRKLAMNMAVVTGVHVTWQDYQNSLTRLERAEYLQSIDEQISTLTKNAEVATKESGAAAIQTQLRAFRSKISRMQSYATAQAAYGDYMVSLGVNPIPGDFYQMKTPELAHTLAENIDLVMFPFTKEGEKLLAERRELDGWIEREQDAQIKRDDELVAQVETVHNTDLSHSEKSDLSDEVNETLRPEQMPLQELVEATHRQEAGDEDLVDSRQAMQASAQTDLSPEDLPVVRVDSDAPLLSGYMFGFFSKYFPMPSSASFEESKPGSATAAAEGTVSDRPDSQTYLQEYLLKYFPRPVLEDYLKAFLHSR